MVVLEQTISQFGQNQSKPKTYDGDAFWFQTSLWTAVFPCNLVNLHTKFLFVFNFFEWRSPMQGHWAEWILWRLFEHLESFKTCSEEVEPVHRVLPFMYMLHFAALNWYEVQFWHPGHLCSLLHPRYEPQPDQHRRCLAKRKLTNKTDAQSWWEFGHRAPIWAVHDGKISIAPRLLSNPELRAWKDLPPDQVKREDTVSWQNTEERYEYIKNTVNIVKVCGDTEILVMSSLHFSIQFVSRLTCSQIESGHIKCFGNVRGVNVPSVIIAGIARQFSTMCVRWSRHLAHLERLILNSECGVLWARACLWLYNALQHVYAKGAELRRSFWPVKRLNGSPLTTRWSSGLRRFSAGSDSNEFIKICECADMRRIVQNCADMCNDWRIWRESFGATARPCQYSKSGRLACLACPSFPPPKESFK